MVEQHGVDSDLAHFVGDQMLEPVRFPVDFRHLERHHAFYKTLFLRWNVYEGACGNATVVKVRLDIDCIPSVQVSVELSMDDSMRLIYEIIKGADLCFRSFRVGGEVDGA